MFNAALRSRIRDESGQAIFLLLMVAITMLFFISLMYHAGAVMIVKMKLQNTADMAAMSAATVQARGMQAIAARNKAIVGIIQEANEDLWGTLTGNGMSFVDDAAANAYIDANYVPRIDDLVRQIRALQTSVGGAARAAGQTIAARNLPGGVATMTYNWHTPRITEAGVGDVFVRLDSRRDATIHYAIEDGTFDKHRSTDRLAYFRSKARPVVYSAVEVGVSGLSLGGFVTSKTNTMKAYAAAKPWGGKITGDRVPNFFTRDIVRVHTVDLPTWSQILNLSIHDPEDYDVWLVSIGSPDLNPPPTTIPNYWQFRH